MFISIDTMNNKVEKFEDLNVWKESMQLVVDIYLNFTNNRDYSFKDQIQRASVSVPSNNSEGFDRQTNKEFIQFLHIAKGSISEVRTQLYFALKLNFIEEKIAIDLLEKTKKI